MIKIIGMRKIIPYLVLNFLVSALAVVVVLFIWDQVHQPATTEVVKRSFLQATRTSVSSDSSAIPPLDIATVEIQGIIGAGDLNTERVTLVNISNLEISLAGWTVLDEDRHELLLPPITVFPGGGIVLHSKAGINSAVEVYANQDEPVFASGEKVRLFDSAGHLRSSFVVP